MTRLRPSARAPLGLPVWIYLPALIGGAFVIAPLAAMLATVQWSQFWELVTSESSVAALKLSLKTAAMSTLLCILFGVPMAAVLARSHFRGTVRSSIVDPAPAGSAARGGRYRVAVHVRAQRVDR